MISSKAIACSSLWITEAGVLPLMILQKMHPLIAITPCARNTLPNCTIICNIGAYKQGGKKPNRGLPR